MAERILTYTEGYEGAFHIRFTCDKYRMLVKGYAAVDVREVPHL